MPQRDETSAGSFSPLQASLASQASSGMAQQLQAMGFSQHSASAALAATDHAGMPNSFSVGVQSFVGQLGLPSSLACWLCTGVEAAANWLLEHGGELREPPVQHVEHTAGPSGRPAMDTFSTHTAGVAGILWREQQLAATTDRHALMLLY